MNQYPRTESDEAVQTIKKKLKSTLTLRLRLHLKLTLVPLHWMKSWTRVLESDNAAEAYDEKIEDVTKILDDKPEDRSTIARCDDSWVFFWSLSRPRARVPQGQSGSVLGQSKESSERGSSLKSR